MKATLYLGDCLDVLATLDAESVDAVVTDPPWVDYTTGRYDASAHHLPVDFMDPSAYMGALFRILKHDTAMILWCRWDCFHEHSAAAQDAGFSVKNCIVWGKPNHTAGDLEGNLGYQHEMAILATKGTWKINGVRDTNLWLEAHLFSRSFRHHPTEKPVGLMGRSCSTATIKGSTIIDPFMGSGTTGVSALRLGMNFIGIEREPDYFDIAARRIAGDQPLFAHDVEILR